MTGAPFLLLQPPPESPVVELLVLRDVGGSHRSIADLSAWLSSTNLTHSLHACLLIGLLGPPEEELRNLSVLPKVPHPAVLEGDASSVIAAAENVVNGVVYTFGKHDPVDVHARLTPHSVNACAGAAYLAPDLFIRVAGVPGAQTQPRTTWQRHLAQLVGADNEQSTYTEVNRNTAVIEVDLGAQNSGPSHAQNTDSILRPGNCTTILNICASGADRKADVNVSDNIPMINPRKFHEGHFTIVKLRRENKRTAPWEVLEVHNHELPLP